ncbi:MAG: hypothetical protein P4M15_12455 [Alphaproteobacteria bacterium]|nr:hypothetical protein [Alphaproteobacteria bacterium]
MTRNPWDGTTLFALSCACVATLKIRRGEIAQAQEIADELKQTPNILGTWFAAQIIEDAIAAKAVTAERIAA